MKFTLARTSDLSFLKIGAFYKSLAGNHLKLRTRPHSFFATLSQTLHAAQIYLQRMYWRL
jgi:hypothetical protein